MGVYLNPDSSDFLASFAEKPFDDTSELMVYTDSVMESSMSLTCVAFPPRSGKTTVCDMLAAYYSANELAHRFFDNRRIALPDNLGATEDFHCRLLEPQPYGIHRGRFDVLRWNTADFVTQCGSDFLSSLTEAIGTELRQAFSIEFSRGSDLRSELDAVTCHTRRRFYVIIDDWDAPFRLMPANTEGHLAYLRTLLRLFKCGLNTSVAGAFLAGVLSIPKIGALPLNNFCEYSTFMPGLVERFFQRRADASPVPIATFLLERPEGLEIKLHALLAGEKLRINPNAFLNRLTGLRSTDAALTLFVHFGYLHFDLDASAVTLVNPAARCEVEHWLSH